MATLTSLFPDATQVTIAQPVTGQFNQLYVRNTNYDSVQNGGFCCLWTVPAGTTWARFEVWGGGGDGGGACCCQQPSMGGGSGSYARKTTRVTPGDSYRICAGGSGCCSQLCQGTSGFPSYVVNPTAATYAVGLCASGGYGGNSSCFHSMTGCYHCATVICGCTCGGDFSLCGLTGSAHASWCAFDSWQYVPQGTYSGGGARTGSTHCGEFWMGCAIMGNGNIFPGGGGGTGLSHNGACCWGGWGAGGQVLVTFK